jgi:hypothetical protein
MIVAEEPPVIGSASDFGDVVAVAVAVLDMKLASLNRGA